MMDFDQILHICIGIDDIELGIVKASLTFKCMTEHLFADFSYSIALDTYL